LNDKIKNLKTLTKKPRKIIRNQKKMDQIKIIIIIEKNKNHKLDLKDKNKIHKTLTKGQR